MWWLFSKSPNRIPYARGPHIPGCCDIMTDYTKNGIFLRVYYPTDLNNNINDYVSRWIRWVPHDSYLVGFGRVLMLWLFVVRLVIWIMSGKLHVPAVYGAKVKQDIKLKPIILSHGLGGHRFLYTSTCIELASWGYIIFALEHRDETPCRTYYYENKSDVKSDNKTFIEHSKVALGNDHYVIRNGQIHKRVLECSKVFDLINGVNDGILPKNILEDLPNNNEIEFNLKQLTGRLDIDNMTMMGHSFGGATSLATLAHEKRIKIGILLDTWMFPIKDMSELTTEVQQPILFINTQTFHIGNNIKALKPFLETNENNRQMYTIKHTTHESQTDSVFVCGYWMNWFMKKLPPKQAIKINNALILRFFNEHLRVPDDVTESEKYLLKENENFYTGLTKPWA